MYYIFILLPSPILETGRGGSCDRNYFLFYSICRCRCSCRLHMQMAWWWGLNGNKSDGLVLPSKIIKQENPRVAARGFSLVSCKTIFSLPIDIIAYANFIINILKINSYYIVAPSHSDFTSLILMDGWRRINQRYKMSMSAQVPSTTLASSLCSS